ncbi:LiaI-LiaF-like domain-containing protein [Acidobacteriota bacterium]
MSKYKRKDPLAWGILLIVLGLIFFLHNTGIRIWDVIARLWPLALIAWGAWKLYYGIKEHKEETEKTRD